MKKSIFPFPTIVLLAVVFWLIPNVSLAQSSDFAGGDGTAINPYQVTNADQLDNVRNYLGSHFIQIDDISYNGRNFAPIGSSENSFYGSYDGGNFAISDTIIVADIDGYAGLFGYSTGNIINVNLRDSEIVAYSNNKNVYSGSIVGYNQGTITQCTSGVSVNSKTSGEKLDAYAGGIVGFTDKDIMSCEFFGEVIASVEYIDSNSYSGGIAGYGNKFTDCNNQGKISSIGSAGSNAFSGGIAAVSGGVNNCNNSGEISATNSKYSYAGGIVGETNSIITGSNNSGIVYASTKYSYAETYTGGIVGKNFGFVNLCYNTGYVSGDSISSHVRAGGIVGYNHGTIEDSYNKGIIYSNSSGFGSYAGGIAGTTYTNSYIRRCYNDGYVTSEENGLYSLGSAGGIVGLLQYGSVIQCYNTGFVRAESSNYITYAAGIAGGTSEGLIVDCFNAGNVHTSMSINQPYITGAAAGIFVGFGTTCSTSYNVGSISFDGSNVLIGGVHQNNGDESNSIEYSYHLNTFPDTIGISMSVDQAKLMETYENFNFDNTWFISSSNSYHYPKLKHLVVADFFAAKVEASELISTDYTISSWELLTIALALPETTNTEIVKKTTAIKTAIGTLVPIVATVDAELQAAKDAANALSEVEYTVASWSVLETALALSEDDDAQKITKLTAINDAFGALERIVKADVVGGTADVTVDNATVAAGETVTVTIANIQTGKQFKSIQVNGGAVATAEVTAGASYTFIMPAGAATVVVEVENIPGHVANITTASTLLVGRHAFNTNNASYTLNNYLAAVNNWIYQHPAGTFHIYYRDGNGVWWDLVADPDLNNAITDLNTINGDGSYQFMNMTAL